MRVRAALFIGLVMSAPPAWAGSIAGQVSASPDGTPISGFAVNLLNAAGGKGWAVVQSLTTNASGSYLFSGVAAGNYIIQAVPMNTPQQCLYAQRYFDSMAPYDAGRLDSSADVISIGAGTNITGINFALNTVGSLQGTVTNGSVGLGGVQVRLQDRSDGRYHVDAVTSASSGTLGTFTVCGVDPGSYLFWIHDLDAQYDDRIAPGPYIIISGSQFTIGNLVMQPMPVDPYEPNSTLETGTSLPSISLSWDSSGALLSTRGNDVDFYCFEALAGDHYLITTTTDVSISGEPSTSPWVDPVLGWFSTSPASLLLSNDDAPGQRNARLETGSVTISGRYCVGVTTYGDPDFNGSGQASAGRYALHILKSDTLFDDGFDP
ncbi:MSCRAMM family protein [Dokdonella immobilis]|uniref:Carboxypeptidase regulatory-like domain-containing protein n=1 Tax=Dokdonella immobilis TaxID=578942 RepID=A0A1I4XKZ6_9GAMM|nr:carboxypeptidase-like regulatory domain-containing protein [Dokdonella immobilis]SFN26462.1 Carboxypeptidase regulatory-like domain-containing protein [Dokdonella immobilis]